jgi:hypothetical protein
MFLDKQLSLEQYLKIGQIVQMLKLYQVQGVKA